MGVFGPKMFTVFVLVGSGTSPVGVQASAHTAAIEAGNASVSEDAEEEVPASRRSSAIDRLIARLDDYGLWTNGRFRPFELPESATTGALISEAFPGVEAHILEERRTVIGQDPRPYLIVHVRVPEGERLMVFRYDASLPGWWNREFR